MLLDFQRSHIVPHTAPSMIRFLFLSHSPL